MLAGGENMDITLKDFIREIAVGELAIVYKNEYYCHNPKGDQKDILTLALTGLMVNTVCAERNTLVINVY